MFQNNRLETLSAKPDAIDWIFYKQHVSKVGFVEMFEKSVSVKNVYKYYNIYHWLQPFMSSFACSCSLLQ